MKKIFATTVLLALAGCSSTDSSSGIKPEPSSGSAGGMVGASNAGLAGTDQGGNSGSAQGGNAGTGATHAGGAAGATQEACPSAQGPSMVAIPTPKGGRFCIDSTEVTRGQYAQFLAAKKADTSGQTTECKQNTTFQPTLEPPNPPGQGGPGCPLHDPLNPEKPNTPMVCIDWCDAKAYCAWAGKRLCGKIGGGQLSSQGDDYSKWDGSNPSIGEWAFTCSQGASTKYPYGNEHKDGACVDDAYRLAHKLGASDQVDVGADPTCHGQSAPYNTVVDLVGSVQEFEDSFIAPKFGAFRWNDNANGFTCTTTNVVDIAATSDSIGFRCCAD